MLDSANSAAALIVWSTLRLVDHLESFVGCDYRLSVREMFLLRLRKQEQNTPCENSAHEADSDVLFYIKEVSILETCAVCGCTCLQASRKMKQILMDDGGNVVPV